MGFTSRSCRVRELKPALIRRPRPVGWRGGLTSKAASQERRLARGRCTPNKPQTGKREHAIGRRSFLSAGACMDLEQEHQAETRDVGIPCGPHFAALKARRTPAAHGSSCEGAVGHGWPGKDLPCEERKESCLALRELRGLLLHCTRMNQMIMQGVWPVP